MTRKASIPTKHCPGIRRLGIAAHDAPATVEVFGRSSTSPDGLGTPCNPCWKAYMADLKARKAAGDPTASRPRTAQAAPASATTTTVAVSDRATASVSPRRAPSGTDAPVVTDHALVAVYGHQAGWSTEVLGTTRYAVPVDARAVGSDAGQEALDVYNQAVVAMRRQRDAARKRAERAAAKAAASA